MTADERAALGALCDWRGSSTTDVAGVIGKTEPVTRRLLRRLEDAGLATSEVIPETHRSKLWWFRVSKGEEDRA